MNDIDIKKAFDFALNRFKANPAFYILGLAIAVLVFSTLVSMVVGPVAVASKCLNFLFSKGFHWMNFIVIGMTFAIKCLVFSPLLVGYLRGIRKEADGETASIADLFSGFKDYISIVVFSAVMGSLLAAGFAFFFLPGLLLCPVFSMGLYYIASGETGSFGIDAIVKAFKNWSIKLELLVLAVLVVGFGAGLLCCCVGLVISMPIAVATVWHVCLQHATGQKPDPSLPSDDQIASPS